MDVLSLLISAILWLMNQMDKVLQAFGIRLFRLTRENILKGLPNAAAMELEKPDIKPFADVLFEDQKTMNRINLCSRIRNKIIFQNKLKSRLLINETIEKIPEIQKVPTQKPIFIVGPARTGTTFLHWLMACDKQFRCPLLWEQESPCPPGPVEDFKNDRRFKDLNNMIYLMKRLNPRQFSAHPSEADKPEECVLLLERSYILVFFMVSSKPFCDLLRSCDKSCKRHIYEYFKLQLQLLGWGQGMESRYYLGKSPTHLLFLDALAETFPDARFIFIYRPLSEVVPSSLSFLKHLHDGSGIDTSTEEYKSSFLELADTWFNGGLRMLDEIEKTHKGIKVHYLNYKDLTADPLGEVRKIYDSFELTLTPEAESAMIHYLENDPKKKKYGKHKYKEGVQFSKEFLEKHFVEYIELMSKRADRKDII